MFIDRCWSQNPENRPNFDEIVEELKNNPQFITEKVDQTVFRKYVDYIENYESSFDLNKRSIHMNDIAKPRKTNFLRVSVKIEKQKIVDILPDKENSSNEDDKNDDIKESNQIDNKEKKNEPPVMKKVKKNN